MAIERPIFVTGLPRTGTTALHRLLCADPAHQGLEQWLTRGAAAAAAARDWADNPLFQHMQDGVRRSSTSTNPEFMGVHYIAADTVEECWQLLRQSMRCRWPTSRSAHVPTYSAWLAGQDWTRRVRAGTGATCS